MAASIAAVPDPVTMYMSLRVSKTCLSLLVVLFSRSAYSGPLWLIIGHDMASRTSSANGIGPGVRRFTIPPQCGWVQASQKILAPFLDTPKSMT